LGILQTQKKRAGVRKLTPEEIAQHRLPAGTVPLGDRTPIIGLLDNIRSLYNVGSIFRTSDGARVELLMLCGYTPSPPRKEIEKTALGATTTVPWRSFPSTVEGIRYAKGLGARIYVLEQTTDSVPYYTLPPPGLPVCLVIGNELTGVTSEAIAEADGALEIPMYGSKQSLNAAVAYGIAVFDLLRIWKTASR
jgi:23S rRNA (guanosine2251-2'-O)-methyltransferase